MGWGEKHNLSPAFIQTNNIILIVYFNESSLKSLTGGYWNRMLLRYRHTNISLKTHCVTTDVEISLKRLPGEVPNTFLEYIQMSYVQFLKRVIWTGINVILLDRQQVYKVYAVLIQENNHNIKHVFLHYVKVKKGKWSICYTT